LRTRPTFLPTAASAYHQAILDLNADQRLSWRGPATDLREALRETLDHLAPDKDIQAEPNFRLEPEAKGPTMKQKVRYILSKRGVGKSSSAPAEDAVSTVEALLGAFVRSVYTRSSVSTHTSTDKNEVLRIRGLVRVALGELLEIPT